jgi:hypothetical protein
MKESVTALLLALLNSVSGNILDGIVLSRCLVLHATVIRINIEMRILIDSSQCPRLAAGLVFENRQAQLQNRLRKLNL